MPDKDDKDGSYPPPPNSGLLRISLDGGGGGFSSIQNPNKVDTLGIIFPETAYSPEEIAEILSGLSDLYRTMGGDSLVIEEISLFEIDENPFPGDSDPAKKPSDV